MDRREICQLFGTAAGSSVCFEPKLPLVIIFFFKNFVRVFT